MNTRIILAALAVATLSTASTLASQGPPGGPGGPGGARDKPPLPLVATRKAEFTAKEATWMSLDVSPDGRTIVFDLLGDLYTMPIAGGKATQLTSGLAFDAQPRFSPDGKKVVFVSDRSGGDNVWIMSLDAKDTTQLTQGNGNLYVSPEWTPDGKYVVVSRAGGLGGPAPLQLVHVEKRSPMAILPASPQTANQKTVGAAFSPDGRYVWYAARAGRLAVQRALPAVPALRVRS